MSDQSGSGRRMTKDESIACGALAAVLFGTAVLRSVEESEKLDQIGDSTWVRSGAHVIEITLEGQLPILFHTAAELVREAVRGRSNELLLAVARATQEQKDAIYTLLCG